MINMIKAFYRTVNITGEYSDSFKNFVGVKQGEPLSPLMFLFFIYDMSDDLRINIVDIIDINGYLIYLIQLADDTALFVIHNGWLKSDYTWKYGPDSLENVDFYIYLEISLHRNGRFNITQKRLSEQGSSLLYRLLSVFNRLQMSVKQKCELFDSMCMSVMCYASEVWGFHRGPDIDFIHN